MSILSIPFTVDNLLTLAGVIVSAFGLLFVVIQLMQISAQARMAASHARHKLIHDVQRFLVDHPEHFEYWVGGARYQALETDTTVTPETLAGRDIVIDAVEQLFLEREFTSSEHELDFVRRMMGNPKFREYVTTDPLRGSLHKKFFSHIQKIDEEMRAAEMAANSSSSEPRAAIFK